MEKQTIFIKHKIESEKPKESGYYHVITITGHNRTNYYSDIAKAFKDDDIVFWLEEREVPTDEKLMDRAKELNDPLIDKFGDRTEGFYKGGKWLKSELGLK